ncbi:MAG: 6-phosphogluconolactonase [Cyanobacteria bacterium SID2]|nr:6-phosphogluconolactonase [Cyanobacteria bacterium SID2]MBP0006698.1 6-phosphogluconolactonase [Cyanobacteria bacterium SBC]
MAKHVEICPDLAAVVDRSRELVLEAIRAAIEQRGRCTLVLAGGNTPKPLYEYLATEDLPWERLHIFWGDERYVSADHPDSNQRMAREAWLDRVPIPPDNVRPMNTDGSSPEDDARRYNSQLQEFFQLEPENFPVFDLVLLGMGADGHTASLFPHTDALKVCDRAVTVGNKDGQPRLTLTIPVLNVARCVIFMVVGANKQAALSEIFAPEGNNNAYPARTVCPVNGELWWLLDTAAGGNLVDRV